MRVLLIDIDSKIPNLALMNISAYHKMMGDTVGFDVQSPDLIYVSCIFDKNRSKAFSAGGNYIGVKRILGGSAISYRWLPKEMQKIKPDYDLYPDMDYSLGFTTRGCIRKCPWCIVPQKEGPLHRWLHPKMFHDERFDKIQLLDNNWLADRKWFFETSKWIIDHDLELIENGFDIRLLDQEIAKRIRQFKTRNITFAFDTMSMEKSVKKGIKILEDVGFNIRNEVQFYVLVGYNTTEEEDKYRCRLLKSLGTKPFVMPYKKNKWTNKLARWANFKAGSVFWACDIDDYDRRIYG